MEVVAPHDDIGDVGARRRGGSEVVDLEDGVVTSGYRQVNEDVHTGDTWAVVGQLVAPIGAPGGRRGDLNNQQWRGIERHIADAPPTLREHGEIGNIEVAATPRARYSDG